MKRAIALVAAVSMTGCSFLTARGPAAPDRPDGCTTTYGAPRADMYTSLALFAPLLLVGAVLAVDAMISASDEEDTLEFHASSYKWYALGGGVLFAAGIPFAISAVKGRGRVDACRRASGMKTGDEELAIWKAQMTAHYAERDRRVEACRAAGAPGTPASVTQTGPDLENLGCATAAGGAIGVHGTGPRNLLRKQSCTYADPCVEIDNSELYKRIAARLPGVAMEPGGAGGCTITTPYEETLSLSVGDWANVDAVIAATRAELAQYQLSPIVTVRIAVAPICDIVKIEAEMPPPPPKPDAAD